MASKSLHKPSTAWFVERFPQGLIMDVMCNLTRKPTFRYPTPTSLTSRSEARADRVDARPHRHATHNSLHLRCGRARVLGCAAPMAGTITGDAAFGETSSTLRDWARLNCGTYGAKPGTPGSASASPRRPQVTSRCTRGRLHTPEVPAPRDERRSIGGDHLQISRNDGIKSQSNGRVRRRRRPPRGASNFTSRSARDRIGTTCDDCPGALCASGA